MMIPANKIIKIAVTVASIGVTLASNYLQSKELDNTVAKKVAEALAEQNKN